MIGKIVGVYKGHYGNTVIVDIYCHDDAIGYEIQMKTCDILSLTEGERCELFIKEIIKEDDDVLYGFISFEDKCWFEEFIKLSGLGPKIALSILSTFDCSAIKEAILLNNCDFFSSISGIGEKLANRIPNEMRKTIDKIHEKMADFGFIASEITYNKKVNDANKRTAEIRTEKTKKQMQKVLLKDNNDKVVKQNQTAIINDAINALISLGFERNKLYNEVFAIVNSDNNISTEDIIKEFLKKIQ